MKRLGRHRERGRAAPARGSQDTAASAGGSLEWRSAAIPRDSPRGWLLIGHAHVLKSLLVRNCFSQAVN